MTVLGLAPGPGHHDHGFDAAGTSKPGFISFKAYVFHSLSENPSHYFECVYLFSSIKVAFLLISFVSSQNDRKINVTSDCQGGITCTS